MCKEETNIAGIKADETAFNEQVFRHLVGYLFLAAFTGVFVEQANWSIVGIRPALSFL